MSRRRPVALRSGHSLARADRSSADWISNACILGAFMLRAARSRRRSLIAPKLQQLVARLQSGASSRVSLRLGFVANSHAQAVDVAGLQKLQIQVRLMVAVKSPILTPFI